VSGIRQTYIEELGELLVREVGHLGVEGADLDVRLLDNELLLSETFLGHEISVFAELGLEVLC